MDRSQSRRYDFRVAFDRHAVRAYAQRRRIARAARQAELRSMSMQALTATKEHPGMWVASGVNMPKLLKLTTSRFGTAAHELADLIRRCEQEHICWPTRAG